MIELHALFKGKVQGVGFRWTVVAHAEKFHLKGTVKNLSNGDVEVFVQGPKESLENFLNAVKKECSPARVDSVSSAYHPINHPFSDFRIIHSL